jgi:tetratricopeptide (TPR) repeat protein
MTMVAIGLLMTLSPASPVAAQTVQQAFEQVQTLEKAGDYAGALALMRRIVQAAPSNDFMLAHAAWVAEKVGSYSEGVNYAQRAIRLNGREPWYYVTLAFNAWGHQDVELTRQACQRALEFGSQRLGRQNYDSARRLLDDVTDRDRLIFWTFDPSKGSLKDGYLYIAVPAMNLPHQTVQYELTGAEEFRAMKVGGNDVLRVKPSGNKPFQLTTRVVSRTYSFRQQITQYSEAAAIPDEVKPYLGKSKGIDPQSPLVVQVASALGSKTKLETVQNILVWIKKNISDRNQIVRLESAEEVIRNRAGACVEEAMVFVALCRACGIPAREVWGVVTP